MSAPRVGLALIFVALMATGAWADACESCHRNNAPGLYRQWANSKHGAAGVSCIDCHGAEATDADAFEHDGATIATLVTPHRLRRVPRAGEHGDAGTATTRRPARSWTPRTPTWRTSPPANPAAIGRLRELSRRQGARSIPIRRTSSRRKSWPNSASAGSILTVPRRLQRLPHAALVLDVAQARQPEACCKCHLGPGPSAEGDLRGVQARERLLHQRRQDEPRRDDWVVGIDYYAAPTCATCHMSATREQPVTHDVGKRIAWTLAPARLEAQGELGGEARGHDRTSARPATADLRRRALLPVRRVGPALQREVRQAGQGDHGHGQEQGLLESPASFSNEIEWDLLGALASRGSPRASRRGHDGPRLHLVARHLRRRPALLLQVHPEARPSTIRRSMRSSTS